MAKLLVATRTSDWRRRLTVARGASPKTVNLEIGTLRAILRRYRIWATIQPDVKMLVVANDVGRAISPAEEETLLKACAAALPARCRDDCSEYMYVGKDKLSGLSPWELRGPRDQTFRQCIVHRNNATRTGIGLALSDRHGLGQKIQLTPAQHSDFRRSNVMVLPGINSCRAFTTPIPSDP